MGFEPMNTGFADQRVSHFAIGASSRRTHPSSTRAAVQIVARTYFGCEVTRRYGFTVL
jgi:hypothetical protein